MTANALEADAREGITAFLERRLAEVGRLGEGIAGYR